MIKMAKKNFTGPEEYRPLSPWAYFGYSVLFTVPLIGLIVNLVLCFSNTNINRRNFARAFWCIYVVVVIAVVLVIAFGGHEPSLDEYIASLNEV